MTKLYAISDIHGELACMEEALILVDWQDKNCLFLLGDYINRGNQGCQVLYRIKELEERYPSQVTILIGNHEQMFLEWLQNSEEYTVMVESYFETIRSFFSDVEFDEMKEHLLSLGAVEKISHFFAQKITEKHSELIKWLRTKENNWYIETETNIYVHAGIFEDEELWKVATTKDEFVWKYPAETGKFYKNIIAGHIGTTEIAKNQTFLGQVFFDGKSHFYIDGETNKSRIVPVLVYDTETEMFTSYLYDDGCWREYVVKK